MYSLLFLLLFMENAEIKNLKLKNTRNIMQHVRKQISRKQIKGDFSYFSSFPPDIDIDIDIVIRAI